MVDAVKDGGEAVVVELLDGIEFMVVAAGAVNGEAKEGGRGGVDHVIEIVGALLTDGGKVGIADGVVRPRNEEAGSDLNVRIARVEKVASDLFHHEAIKRKVLIESADDVIAETPCVGADVILLIAVGFSVADDVEPVASPALAIGGRSEEAVDEFFVGVGGRVVEEGVDFGWCGREAGEVESRAADEGATAGRRGEFETLCLEGG